MTTAQTDASADTAGSQTDIQAGDDTGVDTGVDVIVESALWDAVPEAEALARRAALAALPAGRPPGALCVVLADDAAVQALNARFRGRDAPTNVLSFPAVPSPVAHPGGATGPTPLGDVVLAFETVQAEAARDDKPFAHHLMHLVVHGVLHLLGHDHMTDSDADLMEARERDILASLAVPDPYAGRECA